VLDVATRPPEPPVPVAPRTVEPAPAPTSTPPEARRPRFPFAMVAATIGLLALALAWQLVTIRHGGRSSLSDLPRVFLHRGLAPHHLPYLERVLEYPVGAGILLYLAALVAPSATGVLVVTALGASVAAVVVTVLLQRRNGARAWRWALASPLLLFAFQNWDTFAIAALVGGLVAYERRRPATAGVLLGVGTAIKLFPAVVVPVLVAAALVRGDRRGARRLVVGFVATVLAVNLPVAVVAGHGWWWTMQFQGARAATWGTVWMYAYRTLGLPTHGPAAAHMADVVSMVALALGLAALVAVTVRRRLDPVAASGAAVAVFLLTNKVYSPTYDLWLVAFFVLLPITRRVWITFCALDLGVYLTVFGYFHGVTTRATVLGVLPWLVLARAGVLVAVIASVVGSRDPASARVPVARRLWHGTLRTRDRYAPLVTRLRRCLSVSVITTGLSLVSLVTLTTAGVAPMTANIVTTALATIPSYQLNRRWTWSKEGSSDLWREVVPFWAMSFAGLALSTVTVGIADRWAVRAHVVGALHTVAVLAGHLGGFGLLWVVQFVVLDRVVFARTPGAEPSPGIRTSR
jgi:putative flippase GtrA